MNHTPHFTRRQWLATTAGSLGFAGTLGRAAALSDVAETDGKKSSLVYPRTLR